MNLIAKGIIGATMIAAFGLSHATNPIFYTINSGPTEQLHLSPIEDTFSGTAHLASGFFCQTTCTLEVSGALTDDLTGDTTLTVTDGQVSGGGLCGLLNLSGFPWIGSVLHSTLSSPLAGPVTFTMNNVSVSASICGSCSSQIDVTFDPANGGSFNFNGPITPNGNCNVNGSLTSAVGNYYDI